jgi:pimeloyl-ACP methyl ester carboxylesterase/DNA-binding winged helix-turn-helix (wHTH) protein
VSTFGPFELDVTRFELRRDGAPIHLEPQVFDLLRYLVEQRGRVVSHEELLDKVWGDRFVAETTLRSRIKAVRRALSQEGESPVWIRTARGRGYEFVGPVDDPPTAVQDETCDVALEPDRSIGDDPGEEEVRYCWSDGARIAYAVSGSGRPLVKAANWMTHLGHDHDSPIWGHWLTELGRRWQLVRYDERGCGLSEWDADAFHFDDWVRDLELVVDAAEIDRFPLIGLSQGAAVAIAFAARYPERVERLVLVEGYAAGRAVRAHTPDEERGAALDVELARVGWGSADPAFRRVFAMQFFPNGDPHLWEAFDDLQRRTTSPHNAVRYLETFAQIDVRHLAPQLRCPTLILHGRSDRRVPFQCAEELAQLIPGARLVALPSENHLLTRDEPAWPILLEELERFLG